MSSPTVKKKRMDFDCITYFKVQGTHIEQLQKTFFVSYHDEVVGIGKNSKILEASSVIFIDFLGKKVSLVLTRAVIINVLLKSFFETA